MKPLLFLFAIAFASCGTVKYSTHIDYRDVSQQCRFTPNPDLNNYASVKQVPGGTYMVCDSLYVLHQTASQARAYGRQFNDGLMLASGIAVQGSTIGTFAVLTSNATITSMSGVLIPVFGILVGGSLIGGAYEWPRANGSRYITKYEYYNSYLPAQVNRQIFWSEPAKAY